MPRSQPARPASPPAPAGHRAVIAVTTGIAGLVGLVLLGVGAAAASSGPSPGPAAGPTPVVPVSTVPLTAPLSVPATDLVEIGLPPVPPVLTSAPSSSTVALAQDALAQEALAPTTVLATPAPAAEVASLVVLPDTGSGAVRTVAVAWLALLSGSALLAIRSLGRTPRRLVRVRVDRRADRTPR